MGNNEAQYYTSSEGERLGLGWGIEDYGLERTDGRSFIYIGSSDYEELIVRTFFEIRAKLPTGRGTWPAIWMLQRIGNTSWPKKREIDIMENVGYDPDTIVGSSHTEKYNHMQCGTQNAKIACPDCYKAFHVYALEWEEDEYRLYVDDQLYFTFKNEGMAMRFGLTINAFISCWNLAIGGNWEAG